MFRAARSTPSRPDPPQRAVGPTRALPQRLTPALALARHGRPLSLKYSCLQRYSPKCDISARRWSQGGALASCKRVSTMISVELHSVTIDLAVTTDPRPGVDVCRGQASPNFPNHDTTRTRICTTQFAERAPTIFGSDRINGVAPNLTPPDTVRHSKSLLFQGNTRCDRGIRRHSRRSGPSVIW